MLRLKFQNMDTLRSICHIDSVFLTTNLDNVGFKVPIIKLSKQLFLSHLIYSEDVSNPRDKTSLHLVEGRRNQLTGSLMKQLDPCAILREDIGVDVGHAALSLESGILANSQEKINLSR
jgi:hypothetical protein